MRFNDRVTFANQGETYYDPSIGDYIIGDVVTDVKPAKISGMGINRMNELFGDIKEHVTIARLQHPYKDSFTWVEVDGQRFKVMQESNYNKGVLFLVGDSFADKN